MLKFAKRMGGMGLDGEGGEDGEEEYDYSDEGSVPFMGMGPGGFGGFAPRKGVNEDEYEDDGDEDEEDEDEEDEDGNDEEDEVLESRDTIERLKDDMFPDEDDEAGDQLNGEPIRSRPMIPISPLTILSLPLANLSSPSTNLSAHQKRLQLLSQEIKSLESENVSTKEWTLMGEASARSRPENSLLHTDLEFEHIARPVPLITEETSKTLEDLVKRRIIEVS